MTLDAYLKEHRITHGDFAERVGCEQPTITRFISGRVPSPDLMKKIVDVTEGAVTPNDFFGIVGVSRPRPTPVEQAA